MSHSVTDVRLLSLSRGLSAPSLLGVTLRDRANGWSPSLSSVLTSLETVPVTLGQSEACSVTCDQSQSEAEKW